MKGIRTFVGIFPPPQIQSTIAAIQSTLKADDAAVRWETQKKFHITMKFLGDIAPDQLSLLKSALNEAAQEERRFDIRLTSVGCFPNSRSPRIVWIGSAVDACAALVRCFNSVESACASIGFPKDDRSFHPHITIGRVKGKISENLIKKIENTTFEPLQFLCTELLIMRSDLSPSGSAFSQLSSIPLAQ